MKSFAPTITAKFIALKAIDRLIEETAARWILLSYSSGGRATAEELNDALARHGTLVEVVELDYKRNIMAEMKWTGQVAAGCTRAEPGIFIPA